MTNCKFDKPLIFLILSSCILFSVIFVNNGNPKYQYPKMTSKVFFDVYLPSYVPEGYSCEIIETDDAFASIEFHNNEAKKLYFTQMPYSDSFTLSIDNQNNKITEFESTKYEGYHQCSLKTSYRSLFFWDDENYFEINGYITEDEIIKIANSLSLSFSPD